MQQGMRENLSSDMKEFLQTSKWEQQVKDTTAELLEYRNQRPLIQLYEKHQIKQKVDQQNKVQVMIVDMALQIPKLDPVYQTKDQIITAILKIQIEKHKILKVKKFEAFKCILLLLQDLQNQKDIKEIKEVLIKQFNDKIDDVINSNQFSRMIYCSFLIVKLFQEILSIQDVLQKKSQKPLTLNKLIFFIEEDSEQELTLLSQLGVQSVLQTQYVKNKSDQIITTNNIANPIIQMVLTNHFD